MEALVRYLIEKKQFALTICRAKHAGETGPVCERFPDRWVLWCRKKQRADVNRCLRSYVHASEV